MTHSIKRKGAIGPITKILPAEDLSPIEIFEGLEFNKKRYSFLLESGKGGEKTARYSFLGSDPYLVLKSRGNQIEVEKNGLLSRFEGNPIFEIEKLLLERRVERPPGLPLFFGGAVGYLSYDLLHLFEDVPSTNNNDLRFPEAFFLFVDNVIVFDHSKEEILFICTPRPDDDPRDAHLAKTEWIEKTVNRLGKGCPQPSPPSRIRLPSNTKPNLTKREFEAMVGRAKDYIRAGDVYQVNLSQRLTVSTKEDPFGVYKRLRRVNPAPFAFYLDLEELKLVSSSPERLLRVEREVVQTRPIAGTRPRGRSFLEDENLKKELILDDKERAEHIMLVDLERNDLGRVCKYGSVRVDEMMTIEDYSHVIHIVSNITGTVLKKKSLFDVLRATFPGGTITGTPKIRAMKIIDELEPVRRGPYTGSAGYINFGLEIDLNIIIRTIIFKEDVAYVQVGAGIVADSDPEREHYETLHKAEALIRTLEG